MKQFIALFIFISSINISLASEHRDPKVAHELFTVMKMSKTYQQTIEKMVDVQVAGNPNIKPLKPVLMKFFKKHMGWESMKHDMAKIYTKNFTDEELLGLIQFYKTPLGQKTAMLVPTLTAEGAALGQKRVQENMAELTQMITDAQSKHKHD